MSTESAFHVEGHIEETPIFFFCDHATNTIPAAFQNLGLDARYLETHIGYDIGALDLTRRLAKDFSARLAHCGFSRLLIDPNRSLDREDLIPFVSDGITVPGNAGLTAVAREERVSRFFEPYHKALAREIDAVRSEYQTPLIVSIHSFTPKLHTDKVDRPWEVGVLWAHDEPSARSFMASLSAHSNLAVGDNAPYDARGFNYTIDRHVKPQGLRHLTLEIRQDLIAAPEGRAAIAPLLKSAIQDVMTSELV